jgi:glycosyltransferase involved in cell wall biosynthesis
MGAYLAADGHRPSQITVFGQAKRSFNRLTQPGPADRALPRISIVMPSFNQAPYLEEAIGSVLDQNYPELEFFVFDGGSTDGSKAILERLGPSLTYWKSEPDEGQSAALVEGFRMASGQLLGWLNSDDVLLPGALHRIGSAFRQRPESALLAGNYLLIDEEGRILRCKRHPPNPESFVPLGFVPIAQPGSFFAAAAYESVGGLKAGLRYVMDADLFIRILRNGGPYEYVDAWLSAFRKHPKAKTVAQWGETLVEFKSTLEAYPGARFPLGVRTPLGRAMLMLAQTRNGNYLRMLVESIRARGMPWREWSKDRATQ